MLPADMIQKIDVNGKKQYYIQTPSGKQYRFVRPFATVGAGKAYLFMGKNAEGKMIHYVVIEYPRPQTHTEKEQQRNIMRDLEILIKNPVLDENNQPLASMVRPLELIEFKNAGTFGYVMEYVELADYVSVRQLLKDYPDVDVVCRMAKNLSHFFMRLASAAGYCCKDIDEGKIYLNPKTGDVRIIDNENVSVPSDRIILGSSYYMAPELQTGTGGPNRYTDRFSLAAYLLRMFTGARPYEGAWAIQYAIQHNQSCHEAAPMIFGSKAAFIFDPKDTSNSIRKYPFATDLTKVQQMEKKAWEIQCYMWDHLPEAVRNAFITTFSVGARAENRNKRTTAMQWHSIFKDLEKNIVRCPHCGKKTFGTVDRCFFCNEEIPDIQDPQIETRQDAGDERLRLD